MKWVFGEIGVLSANFICLQGGDGGGGCDIDPRRARAHRKHQMTGDIINLLTYAIHTYCANLLCTLSDKMRAVTSLTFAFRRVIDCDYCYVNCISSHLKNVDKSRRI